MESFSSLSLAMFELLGVVLWVLLLYLMNLVDGFSCGVSSSPYCKYDLASGNNSGLIHGLTKLRLISDMGR